MTTNLGNGDDLLGGLALVQTRGCARQTAQPLGHGHSQSLRFATEGQALLVGESQLEVSIAFLNRRVTLRGRRFRGRACHSRPNFSGSARFWSKLRVLRMS